MASTARLFALLNLMQEHGWVQGDEIAARLEAEPRTVRRDLARLAELGLPVESRRGRYGGYRIRPGFRMPPLMFTDEEATAVVTALVAADRLGLSTAAPATTSALTKIRQVLPVALRDQARSLQDTLGFTNPPRTPQDLDTPTLLRLAEATRHRRQARITYTGRGKAERERVVDPYGLVVNRMRWYVPAFDHDSGELRTFRVDRIRTVSVAGPADPPPPGFDPVTAVADSLARAPWRWEVVLLIHASPESVRRRLPEWLATLTPESEGTVRVTLRAEQLDGAARLLAGIGLPFDLLAPEELRPILAAHAEALLTAAHP